MKFFNHFALFTIVFANLLAVVILWMMFIPLTPIKILNSPHPVLTKQIKRGDQLKYLASFCKYIDTTPHVSKLLVNSIVFALPQATPARTKGCYTDTVMTVTIPTVIPTGSYHLELNYHYPINPFRTFEINAQTEEFEVIGDE